jgi:putative flippase GtrA
MFLNNQKVKYLIAGLCNTVFGYLLFIVLWYTLNTYISNDFIIIISHFISVLFAFTSYRFFVFKSQGNIFIDCIKFNLVYLFTLILNLVIFKLLITELSLSPILIQGITIIFLVILNYFIHKNFTFSRKYNEK